MALPLAWTQGQGGDQQRGPGGAKPQGTCGTRGRGRTGAVTVSRGRKRFPTQASQQRRWHAGRECGQAPETTACTEELLGAGNLRGGAP